MANWTWQSWSFLICFFLVADEKDNHSCVCVCIECVHWFCWWTLMRSDSNGADGDGFIMIDVLPFHSLLVYCSADVTLLAQRLQSDSVVRYYLCYCCCRTYWDSKESALSPSNRQNLLVASSQNQSKPDLWGGNHQAGASLWAPAGAGSLGSLGSLTSELVWIIWWESPYTMYLVRWYHKDTPSVYTYVLDVVNVQNVYHRISHLHNPVDSQHGVPV